MSCIHRSTSSLRHYWTPISARTCVSFLLTVAATLTRSSISLKRIYSTNILYLATTAQLYSATAFEILPPRLQLFMNSFIELHPMLPGPMPKVIYFWAPLIMFMHFVLCKSNVGILLVELCRVSVFLDENKIG